MLSWPLKIMSYGGGTPSTAIVLMACENKLAGRRVHPLIPDYDIVLFCDLHAEPSWVYTQVSFVSDACAQAGIPFVILDADLYGDFTRNYGRRRVSAIPFWTLAPDGSRGKMPRQCTYDYKIKVMERYVRYVLLDYRPRQHINPWDVKAHEMHLGIMVEERRRAKESKIALFTNRYPLVDMEWNRADCFAYNKEAWGIETWASACVFCPFHTNYFHAYLQEHEPESHARAKQVDDLLADNRAIPPLQSKLFLTKTHTRLSELTKEDSHEPQTFDYQGMSIWNGF